jgi:hypothetical protein
MSRDGMLPPGVEESDIPGNRPEDAEWEELLEWISIEADKRSIPPGKIKECLEKFMNHYIKGEGITMERVFQIEIKSMSSSYNRTPKLTIAKDRVAVKFSPEFPEEEKETVCSFVREVAEKIPTPIFTLRGRISIHNNKTLSVSLYESLGGKHIWKCRAEGSIGEVKIEDTKKEIHASCGGIQ